MLTHDRRTKLTGWKNWEVDIDYADFYQQRLWPTSTLTLSRFGFDRNRLTWHRLWPVLTLIGSDLNFKLYVLESLYTLYSDLIFYLDLELLSFSNSDLGYSVFNIYLVYLELYLHFDLESGEDLGFAFDLETD